MNEEELTLQDLIDLLVKRHDMERADADAFVKLFFSLIEEGLAADRYVKIKGLGTFKLIDTRITFSPDSAMKDLVNKPFSHFETVVLNDKTHFDDMPENESPISDAETDESVKDASDSILGNDSDESTLSEEVESASEEMSDVAQGEETSESALEEVSDQSVKEENPVSAKAKEEQSFVQSESESVKRRPASSTSIPWCMVASILLVGVIAGGFMFWSMFRTASTVKMSSVEPKEVIAVIEHDSVASDTLTVDSAMVSKGAAVASEHRQDSAKVVAINPERKEEPKVGLSLSDAVTYTIVGTHATHQLQYGETLVKLARRYYGNKKLWPYIARYNKEALADVDNIPVGTTIRIPELSEEKTK